MISFDNIDNYKLPIKESSIIWRFTEEEYNKLPIEHLNQIQAYNKEGSKFLDTYISQLNLHQEVPFTQGFFKTIDRIDFGIDDEQKVKKWLYKRGFAFDKEVYLSWDVETGAKVPWKILVKYFDDFFYPGPDDLTVFDSSLNWALLFFHEAEIYFGTNENYKLNYEEPAGNK